MLIFRQNRLPLEFRHLMSKVIIYLKSDAMIPGDMIGGEVRILGSVINAKIDLNEGTVIAEGGTGQVVAADEVMKKDGFEIAVKAIIVPQTLKKGVKWLDIKLWEVILILVNCRKDIVFQPGKQMTLSVSIESGECHVTVEEIEDWTEIGDSDCGGGRGRFTNI